jgi:DNA-directed RNA polymerase specialized sigma24 family protein
LQPNFDADWRRRALAGQVEAVRALAEAALAPLYAFCLYRVGRNRHLCEEVVQETMVRAQALRKFGHNAQAQALYRQLAEGHWQPRFQRIQEQARQRLREWKE